MEDDEQAGTAVRTGHGLGSHMITGSRVCSTSTRPTRPTITNETSPHYAEALIEGPPGTGKSQTIANLIATMAAQGRTVLFVAEKRAAIDAVLDYLAPMKLDELILDLHETTRRRGRRIAEDLDRALQRIGRIPALTDEVDRRLRNLDEVRAALTDLRGSW
jgi:Rad3-related DNA helicase